MNNLLARGAPARVTNTLTNMLSWAGPTKSEKLLDVSSAAGPGSIKSEQLYRDGVHQE